MNDAVTSSEHRMIRFLMGLVFVAGVLISAVGLLIVQELSTLSASREGGFVEIKSELKEIKASRSADDAEWALWRNKVDQKLEELSKEMKPETPNEEKNDG